MKIYVHKFGTKPLHELIWCCPKCHAFLVDFEIFNFFKFLCASALSEEACGFLGFRGFFVQLYLKIIFCVCFLEVVLQESICLYLWEKYGWEHYRACWNFWKWTWKWLSCGVDIFSEYFVGSVGTWLQASAERYLGRGISEVWFLQKSRSGAGSLFGWLFLSNTVACDLHSCCKLEIDAEIDC